MDDASRTEHTLATGGLQSSLTQTSQTETLEQATRNFLPEDRQTWLNLTVLPRLDKMSEAPELHLQLKERYSFVKKLGQGASGEVELVLDLDILRLVALKRLHANNHNTKAMLGLINEIRIVGHLEHPNIVPIHDVGRDSEEHYYFVMKYTPGATLAEILDRLKKGHKKTHIDFPLARRITISREVLKAVEFAHFHGIIHRDIKPSNIIIGDHGEVTLMDWGIAKYLKGAHTKQTRENKLLASFESDIVSFNQRTHDDTMKIGEREGTVIGTFAFMAPEQAAGKNSTHDYRTDIYSLCALFYEFLTLQSYIDFPEGNVQEVLKAIRTQKPIVASSVRSAFQPQLPKEWSNFIMKGLKKEPDERHQSVHEMQDIVDSILVGEAPVQDLTTFSKRMITYFINFLEDAPIAGLFLILLLTAIMITGVVAMFTGFSLVP